MTDKKDPKVSDVLKKIVSSGVNALGEANLPKEVVNALIKNVKGTKEEVVETVKQELRKYLSNVEISKIIDEIISNYDFEINVSLKKKKKK